MSICEQLRISETFFDGYELPLTIQDALIFFSTEIEDQNNIPHHIKKLLDKIRINPGMTDEDLIKDANISWFCYNVTNYVTSAIQNENSKLRNFYSIFNFCIEHYDIYQIQVPEMERFRNMCQQKINEVLDAIFKKYAFKKYAFNLNKNHPFYPVYQKCHELQDLHIRDHIVEDSMITYRRGDEMMG